MKQASRPNKTGGFSLIAVSILLTVAALVFASLLPARKEAGDVNQKALNIGKKLELGRGSHASVHGDQWPPTAPSQPTGSMPRAASISE